MSPQCQANTIRVRDLLSVCLFLFFFCQIVLIYQLWWFSFFFFLNLSYILSFIRFPLGEFLLLLLLLLLSKDWTRYHFRFYFLLKPYRSIYFEIFCVFLLFFSSREKNVMGSSSEEIWIRLKYNAHVILPHIYFPSCLFDVALFSYCTASKRLFECTHKRDSTCVWCFFIFYFLVSFYPDLMFADLQSDPVALLQQISKCCTPHTLSTVLMEDVKLQEQQPKHLLLSKQRNWIVKFP